jgi:hypothetical protein
MPTSHPLHPVAADRLSALQTELEREFSRDASERKILNAVVYGTTPAQLVGMLEAFTAARLAWNDANPQAPAKTRAIGGSK